MWDRFGVYGLVGSIVENFVACPCHRQDSIIVSQWDAICPHLFPVSGREFTPARTWMSQKRVWGLGFRAVSMCVSHISAWCLLVVSSGAQVYGG